MNSATSTIYMRRFVISTITLAFLASAFAALLGTYYFDPHFDREVEIYQYPFMPSEYETEDVTTIA